MAPISLQHEYASVTAAVAVMILAAGRGTRFVTSDQIAKVAAYLHGVPLVRLVATTALASNAVSVTAVTGPAHRAVVGALCGLQVKIVHNANYASGIASSLRTGLEQVTDDIDGILVMLADMPLVKASTLDQLMTCFDKAPHATHAAVPVHEGRRGNPVLIGRSLFARIETLSGDEGARQLLSAPDLVIEHCEVADPGVTLDVDTLAELEALHCRQAAD